MSLNKETKPNIFANCDSSRNMFWYSCIRSINKPANKKSIYFESCAFRWFRQLVLLCNFKINILLHVLVLVLFSSKFKQINTKLPFFFNA